MSEHVSGDLAKAAAMAPMPERKARKQGIIPFQVVTFELPDKGKESFPPNEQGQVISRVARAIVRIAGSEICFTAWISEVTQATTGEYLGHRASLPSSGKGFPRPVFVGNDSATKQALSDWKDSLVDQYFAWDDKNKADGIETVAVSRPSGLIRRPSRS